jgi:hypothetical protein
MIRLASFFALACLTLAATALLKSPPSLAEDQPQSENNSNTGARNRLAARNAQDGVPFHARFSLN